MCVLECHIACHVHFVDPRKYISTTSSELACWRKRLFGVEGGSPDK